jgi:murein L,D-transpeptidase YafK
MILRRRALAYIISILFLLAKGNSLAGSFREEQNRFPRVRAARLRAQPRLEELFKKAGVTYPPRRIFLRLFKREGECELWAANQANGQLTKITTYTICATSGDLGPKRREGDGQVPEGFYLISAFNPWSQFHLSLKIDYPNACDRVLSDRRHPGGDIFIHGSCVTIGCIPLRDDPIEEIYLAAVDARASGQTGIPVHIFPARMSSAQPELERLAGRKPALQAFWQNLHEGFAYFEKERILPKTTIDRRGRYLFSAEATP